MHRFTSTILAVSAWALLGVASKAEAQVPIPTTSTPTVHGGTPVDGSAVAGDIGYAQLRAGVYFGSGDRDIGIEMALPTFGDDALPGWNQHVGIDLRAPFRLRLANWSKATGSFKVGPYFHVGNLARHVDGRSVGLGVVGGFVTDIALPKIFKLIVGIEQQLGMVNGKVRDHDGDTEFAGATWLDFGLEAFWKNIFFTLLFNAGAQYGSNELHYNNHALFRQMVGAGYKWK